MLHQNKMQIDYSAHLFEEMLSSLNFIYLNNPPECPLVLFNISAESLNSISNNNDDKMMPPIFSCLIASS